MELNLKNILQIAFMAASVVEAYYFTTQPQLTYAFHAIYSLLWVILFQVIKK